MGDGGIPWARLVCVSKRQRTLGEGMCLLQAAS